MAEKFKVIISDLHIGPGDTSAANPLEDFTADDDFSRLLADIAAESEQTGKDAELIINGDFLEFLQVPAVDDFDPNATYSPAAYRDTTAAASVKQLKIITANHPKIFAALADFLHPDPPVRRVTILNGNHDANLYWADAQNALREAIGAKGHRRECLQFATTVINRDGIWVEHGNQRTEKVNRFPDFDHPTDPADPNRIYLPPGSEFVISYFNYAEKEAWWLDNVKPFTSLIWFALQWNFDLAADLLLGFLVHSPGLLVGSFAVEDGDSTPNLVTQLEDDAQRAELAARYAADPAVRRDVHRQIAVLLRAAGAPQPPQAFGALIGDDPLVMAQAEQEEMRSVLAVAARQIIEQGKAKAVFFGHTHQHAFEKIGDDGYYINTGAWLWNEDMSAATRDTWFDLFNHPEKFTDSRRLPYARVDYDAAGNPVPQLLDYSGQGFPPPPNHRSFWQRLYDWFLRLFGAG